MSNYPIFLSGLAEDDRKLIRHCIRLLLHYLRACEGRLRSYEAENAEAEGNNVVKIFLDLNIALVTLDEVKTLLIEKHRLPNSIGQINEEVRQDFRNLLRGIPLE